jgi:hypothetical protein
VVDLYTLRSLSVAAMTGIVIQPKHEDGTPIDVDDLTDLLSTRIDIDATPGIQEAKPWLFLHMFVSNFQDADSSGLPEVPSLFYDPSTGLGMGRFTEQ